MPDDADLFVTGDDPDKIHDMTCPCGCEYTISERAMLVVAELAEYARHQDVNARVAQWISDLGISSPRAIIMAIDRRDVALFLDAKEGRRTRRAWRKVAAALDATAPFDLEAKD